MSQNLPAALPATATQSFAATAPVPDVDTGPEAVDEDFRPALDLRRLYVLLRRNVLLILSVMTLFVIGALVFTILATRLYVAEASIQIDMEGDRVLNATDLEPSSNLQDADRFLQTQVDALRSRAMAIRVAKELGLFQGTTFFDQMKARVPEPENLRPRDEQLRNAVIGIIQDNLSISLPRQSRIAVISFESPDPELSAKVANAYASGFIEYNLERKFDSSSYARTFLSGRLDEARERLQKSEEALVAFANQAGIVRTGAVRDRGDDGTQVSVTGASLAQLNEAANIATQERIAAEQKWRTVANAPLLSIAEVQANPAAQDLVQKLAEKRAALSEERSRHQESYPTVVSLAAEVSELEAQFIDLATGIKRAIRDKYTTAQASENELLGQVTGLKRAVQGEEESSTRYNILARDLETNRTLYDGLLQRFNEVSAQAGITRNNISIIDLAEVPLVPSSPNALINLAIALLAGGILSFLFVYAREQFDDAVREPQDLEVKLGLSLLGIVPKTDKDADIVTLLDDVKSDVSESYSALRTNLSHSTTSGLPRSLLITSTQPAEGKSTSCYAISRALARLGVRTVLVDVDLRRPSLHRYFGIESGGVGLSSVLTSQATLAEASVLLPDHLGLTFVAAGPIAPSPTELLDSDRMIELLAELRDRYEVVLLDGPPVLGLADAVTLSTKVDAVVMVVEANRSHRGAAKNALRRLRSVKANILGGLLTKFDPKHSGTSYYYQYEYYYYGSPERAAEARAKRGFGWLNRDRTGS